MGLHLKSQFNSNGPSNIVQNLAERCSEHIYDLSFESSCWRDPDTSIFRKRIRRSWSLTISI